MSKDRIFLTYDELCTFDVLYEAFLNTRKGKRNKKATAKYEANSLKCTEKLTKLLIEENYKPRPFENFTIHEPKVRDIQAPAFVDKVVLRAIVDEVLYRAIVADFIRNNHASQKGKGQLDGIDRLEHGMREYYAKYHTAEGWVLKCDVHHFFASINHEELKKKLIKVFEKNDIDMRIYRLIEIYIDSSEGLPLGYQTSQLFALLFLNDFDHWVKEEKHMRWYGRYMDDFYFISNSKEELNELLKDIRWEMFCLDLELNNKTAIFPLKNGIDFIGFHFYLTDTGKVITRLRRSSVKKVRARIKKWRRMYDNNEITAEEIKSKFLAWDAFAAYGDTYKLREKYANQVSEIIGEQIIPHRKINSTRGARYKRKLKAMRLENKKYKQVHGDEGITIKTNVYDAEDYKQHSEKYNKVPKPK